MNGWKSRPHHVAGNRLFFSEDEPKNVVLQGRVLDAKAVSSGIRILRLSVTHVCCDGSRDEVTADVHDILDVHDIHDSSNTRHLDKEADSLECLVVVDEAAERVSAWLAVNGARRLLIAGSSVEVIGLVQEAASILATPQALPRVLAHSIRVVSVFPDPATVARCLLLPDVDLNRLFGCGVLPGGDVVNSECNTVHSAGLVGLASALRPCSTQRCAELRSLLRQMMQAEKRAPTVVHGEVAPASTLDETPAPTPFQPFQVEIRKGKMSLTLSADLFRIFFLDHSYLPLQVVDCSFDMSNYYS